MAFERPWRTRTRSSTPKRSGASDPVLPVAGLTMVMHDRENSKPLLAEAVEYAVREMKQQATADHRSD